MFYLIYISEVSSDLESAHTIGMLDRAITNNLKTSISSCLLRYRSKFIQYLEGDMDEVLELFDRIEIDKFHTDVSILSFGPIHGREFQTYGLHYEHFRVDDDNYTFLKLLLDSFITSGEDALDPKPSSLHFWSTVRMFLEQKNQSGKEKTRT